MTDVFSIKDFRFPEGFLWGSSTAAHQIEGNNIHSSSWHDEQKKLAADPSFEVSGTACNHYNMVEEDVQLLSDLGHQALSGQELNRRKAGLSMRKRIIMCASSPCSRKKGSKPLSRWFTSPFRSGLLKKETSRSGTISSILSGI